MSAVATDIDLRDPAGFAQIFEAFRAPMLTAATAVLHDQSAAEDVVQDIFVQLWLSPGGYDPRRGSLRSYLVMLARSRAIDRWRSRGVARGALERSAGLVSLNGPLADDAAEIVIRRDGTRAALAAVTELPRPQQEALLLAYGGGFSAREVAAAAGIPLGTAKSRLRLGLRSARQALTPKAAG